MIFKLASSDDILEPQKNALQHIAFQLQNISHLFVKAKHTPDYAQQSLDRLSTLQMEKKAYSSSFLEVDAKRKKIMTKDVVAQKHIAEINRELTRLHE